MLRLTQEPGHENISIHINTEHKEALRIRIITSRTGMPSGRWFLSVTTPLLAEAGEHIALLELVDYRDFGETRSSSTAEAD
jgi:hypothetical protein